MTIPITNGKYLERYFCSKKQESNSVIDDIKFNLTNIINNCVNFNDIGNNLNYNLNKTINIISKLQEKINSLKIDNKKMQEKINSLKIDNEKMQEEYEDKNKCCICFENKCNIAFISCGHACICEECATELQQIANDHIINCPLCRKNSPLIKIYLN